MRQAKPFGGGSSKSSGQAVPIPAHTSFTRYLVNGKRFDGCQVIVITVCLMLAFTKPIMNGSEPFCEFEMPYFDGAILKGGSNLLQRHSFKKEGRA